MPLDGSGRAKLNAEVETRIDPASDSLWDASVLVACPAWIGPHRIIRAIGSGGMGVVFEAEQAHTHRRVALKVMRGGVASVEAVRRFHAEVEILGRLQHAGIAQIYEADVDPAATHPFFTMELVRGQTLDVYAREACPGVRRKLELVRRIAEAVGYAHQQGIIHLDLKPANVLITPEGAPKVLDFGISRVASVTGLAKAREVAGTLAYMSPEQARGDNQHLAPACDVYALGVMTHQLLTGTLPYELEHSTRDEALETIQVTPPKPLGLRVALSSDVEAVVAKSLDKNPSRRYATATEFARDIANLLEARAVVAREPSITAAALRWLMRDERVRQAGLLGLGVSIALVLVHTTFLLIALGQAAGVVPLWPEVVPTVFAAHMVAWIGVFIVTGWLSRGMMRGEIRSLLCCVVASLVLVLYCAMVMLSLLSYDVGGAANSPQVRAAVFGVFLPLAAISFLLSCQALVSSSLSRTWE